MASDAAQLDWRLTSLEVEGIKDPGPSFGPRESEKLTSTQFASQNENKEGLETPTQVAAVQKKFPLTKSRFDILMVKIAVDVDPF